MKAQQEDLLFKWAIKVCEIGTLVTLTLIFFHAPLYLCALLVIFLSGGFLFMMGRRLHFEQRIKAMVGEFVGELVREMEKPQPPPCRFIREDREQ